MFCQKKGTKCCIQTKRFKRPLGEQNHQIGKVCGPWLQRDNHTTETVPRPPDHVGAASAEKTTSKRYQGASLVAQWLRICLLMQGTRVRALVWEDPTCHGAAGPVSHNC